MVWGNQAKGAWADAVDEEGPAQPSGPPPSAFPSLGTAKADDFPDLAAASKVKESKKDKKKKEAKKQTLSLTDFLKSDVGGGGSAGPRRGGGGDIDLMSLPTAPRQRAEGEEPSGGRGLGGGFREYGGGRGGGRFGDEERPRRRRDDEEDMGPSRADASDNWGAERKFVPAGPEDRGRGGFGGGFRDREERGGFGGGFRDRSREGGFGEGPSRADEADDWGKTKQFVPSSGGERRGGFGGSFRDREERGGFGGGFRDRSPPSFREPSKADTEERWGRASGGDFKPTAFEDRPRREFDDRPPRPGRFGFGDRDGSRDRRDLSRDDRPSGGRDLSGERSWRRADASPAPAGGDEPQRERPRLNLAPRSAAPAGDAGAAAGHGASKASVFGAARPREEVLREQGRDAVKEDLRLEHEAVDRPETAEEKALKQEITNLQVRVEAGEADAEYEADEAEEGEGEGEEAPNSRTVAQALEDLEGRLQRLQLDLDAKAKYARAAGAGERERSKERAPRREPSPGGWRRGDGGEANGSAPRAFRDDRPDRRPPSGAGEREREREGRGGFDDRPSRRGGFEDRGDRGGRRDNFPPRDRDGSRDKPRW